MGQNPTSSQPRVFLDKETGEIIALQPGETVEQGKARAKKEFGHLLAAPPMGGPKLQDEGARQMMQNLPGFLSEMFTLGAGAIPGGGLTPAALRTLLTAVGGGAESYFKGEDPKAGAAIQGGMEAGSGALAHYIPKGAIRTALALGGGSASRNRKLNEQIVSAVMDEAESKGRPFAERTLFPMGLGNQKKTGEAIERFNDKLGTAIDTSPAKVHVDDLRNTTSGMHTPNVDRPIDRSAFINEDEADFIGQQRRARGATRGQRGPSQTVYTASIQPKASTTTVYPPSGPPLGPGARPQVGGTVGAPPPGAANATFSIQANHLPGQWIPGREPDPLSMRDLQDTLLDLTHGKQAIAYMEGLKGGALPSATDVMKAEARATRGAKLKGLRNLLVPEAAEADKHLARLHTIQDANKSMRGGGGIFGDTGLVSMRAALGSGLGGTVAYLTGQPVPAGMAVGSLLGVGAANPRVISSTGLTAGKVARWTPQSLRLIEAEHEVEDFVRGLEEKRKTRRREPGK